MRCARVDQIRSRPLAATKAAHTWKLWLDFCKEHSINAWFPSNSDPLPFLQVFGRRYGEGRFSYGNQPVRASTVADAIRMVGRRYQQLGTRDFQVGRFSGQLDFRLQRQVKAFENEDLSATRVKSVPLQLVQHVVTAAHKSTSTSDAQKAIAGMACLAFFFLLRPEEYTYTKTRHPSGYKPFTYTSDNVGSAPPMLPPLTFRP
jgi:hypothetical protein